MVWTFPVGWACAGVVPWFWLIWRPRLVLLGPPQAASTVASAATLAALRHAARGKDRRERGRVTRARQGEGAGASRAAILREGLRASWSAFRYPAGVWAYRALPRRPPHRRGLPRRRPAGARPTRNRRGLLCFRDSGFDHSPGFPTRMAQRGHRLIEAAKQPLPEGTFAVGAGLMVAGVTTYGFQILGFRALSKTDYAALNALWVFVFVLAPGIFLPLEQGVGRAIAARRARDLGGGPVARRAGALGLAFAVSLSFLIVAVAAFTPIVSHLFNGNTGLIACLVISLFTYGFELLTRGLFAGAGRFGAYGVSMGAAGVIRLLPALVLAAAGVSNPLWYGLCLAFSPALATLVALRGQRDLLPPGPNAPWSELSVNLGYLLFGSLFAQVLSYAPFLGAQVLATSGQRAAVADFIVGLFLSRIPILLFQAVQAALLPKLAGLVSA